jgi:hypothetical protein
MFGQYELFSLQLFNYSLFNHALMFWFLTLSGAGRARTDDDGIMSSGL